MHASSIENMLKCYERYISGQFIEKRESVTVLDIGGADVNGSYRDVFSHPKIRYVAADLQAKEGVGIVLRDPYKLPLNDASIDVVISGQSLEHCEFFWLTFQEMSRVVKNDGFIFLIAPSSGPIHRYPVDCYRFYPDAYGALAKYANCHLEAVWLDERGPWKDLVGVFRKHFPLEDYIQSQTRDRTEGQEDSSAAILTGTKPAPVDIPPGPPEAEITKGVQPYLEILKRIHEVLDPAFYLEIGVRRGHSLHLSRGRAVGVDPNFDIEDPLPNRICLFSITSDAFFEGYANKALDQPIDLAFIDGMHLFEFALRDFMNIERFVHPASLIIVDDIFPNHPLQATRERCTRVWTGDIWKLYICMKKYRPDLVLLPVNAHPSGLLIIAGLEPKNQILWENYNAIVRRFSSPDFACPPTSVIAREGAFTPEDSTLWTLLRTLHKARTANWDSKEVRKAINVIVR